MSEINLTNQDCFELFKIIKNKSIDLVLTDPPFGMAFKSNHRKVKHDKILNDDNLDWLPFWVEEIKRIIKDDAHLYIFCSNHFVDIFVSEVKKHLPYKNILIAGTYQNTNAMNYRWVKNVNDISVDKFADPGIDSDKYNSQFNFSVKFIVCYSHLYMRETLYALALHPYAQHNH